MLDDKAKKGSQRLAGPSVSGPAQELIDSGFAWEIADAPVLHHGLNIADLGHVLDLMHRGIIPDDAAKSLLRVLLQAHETKVDDFPYNAAFGEPYNSREKHFVSQIGDAAGWLHAGRPRREAARVAFRVEVRRLAAELIRSVSSFAEISARFAREHRDVLMADQTYLQQAQPSTFGHYLLAFVPPALRDAERMLTCLSQINQSPGGAGCVNGTQLLEDRTYIASLMGFDGVIEHTRDAMWQTDTFIDILSSAVSALSNQSKLAEDLEIWSSQEFDYVDLAGPYTRSSVLMPQKRNPYSLSIVRGGGGVLIGRLSGFLAVVKSPSARSDNLIFAYGEVPRALEFSTRISDLMTGVVDTLTINRERMRTQLENSFCQATDLAEHIMLSHHLDYRMAYRIVGEAVRVASRSGLRGVDITPEIITNAAQEVAGIALIPNAEALKQALDPSKIVASRSAPGGAAPEVVLGMAEGCIESAAVLKQQAEAALEQYNAAETALLQRAADIINDD